MCRNYINLVDARASAGVVLLIKSADIIRVLKQDGWELVRVSGSHHQFRHPTKVGMVTVPHPKKETPIGTISSIEKQAGVKIRR